MASSILGKKDEYPDSKRNHPVDAGHLLAIIRDQHLDNEAFVRQHLTECEWCRQGYAELMQTSRMLEVLGPMARYQRYPELASVQVLVKVRQSIPLQRSSSYSLPARGVTLPVAVILIIMAIAIVIALALVQIGKLPAPWYLPRDGSLITSNPALINELKQHQPSPTLYPTQISTGVPGGSITATLSPTSTVLAGPTIAVCPVQRDLKDHLLDICGSDFTPGDRVWLYLQTYYRKLPLQLTQAYRVSNLGNFTGKLHIYWCVFASIGIYASDAKSHPFAISNTLNNVFVPGCILSGLTPTPTFSPTSKSSASGQ